MLKKLLRNFGFSAIKTLGFKNYVSLVISFASKLTEIIKIKSLQPVDVAFTKLKPSIQLFKFNKKFQINLQQIDEISNEESCTFGLVREIFINDCYFRGFEQIDVESLKTVVDLGGNRGIFTVLASGFANKIIYVEVQKKYDSTLKLLLKNNNYQGEIIQINKYIGGKGSFLDIAYEFISIEDLIKNTGTNQIDFLKIDIEGAEFQLFDNGNWLKKVRNIAMEIHPAFGSVKKIIEVLNENNFKVKLTDMNFKEVTNSIGTDLLYLYAKK